MAAAAIALFTVTLAWRFLTFTGFSNDHYAHYALAQQLLLGERPIRDFSDPGWPLTYALSAAAWKLAGNQMVVEWAIAAVALAAGAAFTVITAFRLSASLWIALAVTLLEVVIYPRTYAYPKVVVYAFGAWAMMAMAGRPSHARIVLMAATVATAFLLRHDHGLYLGLAAAAWVVLASRAAGWRTAIARAGVLTLATGAVLLPWLLFVSLNGGLVAYFDRAIEYAAAEANASNLRSWPRLTLRADAPLWGLAPPDRPLAQVRWVPGISDQERSDLERRFSLEYVRDSDDARWYYVHDPSEDNLEALAGDAQVAETSGLGRVQRPIWRDALARISPTRLAPALHTLENADAWLFWLYWTLPWLCGVIALRRMLTGGESWPGELAVVIGLCVIAACVNAGFLRDALRTRLSDAIVPAALLGAWTLGLCWARPWSNRLVQRAAQAVAVAALFVTIVAVGQIGEWPERIENTGFPEGIAAVRERTRTVSSLLRLPHRQEVSTPSRMAAALMPFFRYLDRCTTAADQLVVTGEYPDVVALSGRGFASDGVVFGAWYSSAAHQDETVEQMRDRPPLFVIYIDQTAFRQRFPLVDTFVNEGYRPMAGFDLEGSGRVPVLVDRRREPARVDAGTGWPCFSG